MCSKIPIKHFAFAANFLATQPVNLVATNGKIKKLKKHVNGFPHKKCFNRFTVDRHSMHIFLAERKF